MLGVLRVEELIRNAPTLAHVPVYVLDGSPVTLGELVKMCRKGNADACRIIDSLSGDPPKREDILILSAHFYRQLPPTVKVYVISYGELTGEQIARLIESRNPIGEYFIKAYCKLLEVVRRAIS